MSWSITVSSKTEVAEAWFDRWRVYADGADVLEVELTSESYIWLQNPGEMFLRVYLRCGQLGGGYLSTKEGCAQPESIGYILQKCEVKHDVRCARHSRLAHKLAGYLRGRSLLVLEEFTVPLKSSYCKPDSLVIADGVVYVIDVTVVSGYRLKESWDLMIAKYSPPEISAAIMDVSGKRNVVVNEIAHLPFVVSCKGFMLPDSVAGLKRLRLGRLCPRALGVLARCGSLACYDKYMQDT
ncbi:hypothetical protein EG68_09259 [Paragonimus skrjabini miyazakii]|uniref:Uncharacterized protein n=1 Tax=Paragonimus skrjabini miyazakii TaxID=59628 RepID=A0A8S9YHL5_9TREM|nr:hypothetical protein EG68_09259 [Paragonimus skrjabini miyazakii]